ncbi:hypothetical protein M427DRAFT_137910 [Gonapodya prolifera JEL478]|uniref:SH3 domain-containing protein n=1 Tax=Gonapodya prolifera (strain JEL478) TaxID=1344416 RepID=A0A139A4V0_GONPJ|nr:hypothetical protein M427DRAFT_137910 [Gonapodya prolifera JEL478]|eukprot:KXS11842.1 hypothetical protein M427DRAFT_137910 [Gonapodya prolifera JEL478]
MAGANGKTEGVYAGNFWDNGERGLEVLSGRMRDGKHTCEAVLELYQKRIEIESEYAAKLASLAKLPIGKDEQGTLQASLDIVRAELERASKTRLDIAKQMKAQLEAPLAALIVNQAAGRKSAQSGAEKNLKAKNSMAQIATQSRQNLERKVQEWNSAVADRSRSPPPSSQYDQVLAVEKDHQATVAKMNEAHARWRDEWRGTCDTFQKLDSDRIDFLRSSLWNYANIFSTVCVADDEGCERVRISLEKCDIEGDVGGFARVRGTGRDVPAPPSFPPLAISPPPTPAQSFSPPPASMAKSGGGPGAMSPPMTAGPPGSGYKQQTFGGAYPQSTVFGPPGGQAQGQGGQAQGGFAQGMQQMQMQTGMAQGQGQMQMAQQMQQQQMQQQQMQQQQQQQQIQQLQQGGGGAESGSEGEDETFEYDPYDLSIAKPVLYYVRVLYNYAPQAYEELAIAKGQFIPVVDQQEDGWWEGEVLDEKGRKRRGLFPSNFVEKVAGAGGP